MSEVGPPDRSRLLRSKKNELSGIVTSRKRKLREFFAVCDNEGPIPQIKYQHPDAPASSIAENRFLEVTDILKDRLFDESNLPTRRQLRSESSKQKSPTRKPSPDTNNADALRKKKSQRDGSTSRRVRAPTPKLKEDDVATIPLENGTRKKTVPMVVLERFDRRGSQTNPLPEDGSISNNDSNDVSEQIAKPKAVPSSTNSVEPVEGSDVLEIPESKKSESPAESVELHPAVEVTVVDTPGAEPPVEPVELLKGGKVQELEQEISGKERSPDLVPSPKHVESQASGSLGTDESTKPVELPAVTEALKTDRGEQILEDAMDIDTVTTKTSAESRAVDSQTKTPSVAPDAGNDSAPLVELPKDADVSNLDPEGQTPNAAMEVDSTTIKDSFDSEAGDNGEKTPSVVNEIAESGSESPVDAKRSSTTPTSATARTTPTTPAAAPPVLERMTTRISSNTIRHKSVAEIIGEVPRPTATDKSLGKINTTSGSSGTSTSPSRSSTPQSPGTRMRSLVEKAKERERSKLSTVTFQKRTNKSSSNDIALMPTGSQGAKPQEDYLKPLFIASATNDKRGIPALDSLLATAHKTITTANAYVPIHESQTNKILKRIYQLQNMNKWSLRQPKRAPEPNRPTTHWDVLLQEAKWMRTDFREEYKWKSTVARNLAFACAEWVEASPEDRKLLQIKTVPPKFLNLEKDIEMTETSSQEIPHSTPDLVASGSVDSPIDDFDEEPRLNLLETVAPTAIFALQDDDVVFGLRRSPTADKLLEELPMYGAPLRVPRSDILTSEVDPDRLWRRPALPLSKYVEGRMELKFEGPPRKKSRYEYEDEDDDEDEVVFGEQGQKRPILPPETTHVALFDPQHKHIRDRIHSSHQFRPPSEFAMPLQSFFETRTPSQWTWDEDNELKSLVRECTYNWSLISSMLTSKSLFAAGNERRTPWECFERWVQMEGLPNDMQKTHYFRAYMSRIEAANRNVVAQAAAAQAQSMANGQAQPPPRRRATTSIRVDQRRKQKHLTLVDAMRKLAKKRETNVQKQHQAASMAAMRKANENQQPAQPRNLHTPQEFSRLKHDRDEQFKERLLQLQQRQEAQRRAVMLQQRNAQGQGPTPGGPPIAGSQPRPPPPNGLPPPNGVPNGQNLQVPGQNRNPRPMPPQMTQQMSQQMAQKMQNNLRVPQNMNSVPPAPMQSMQGQLPMPNPAVSVGLINQAAQTAEQQRAMIQMQQQGKPNGQSPQTHNSPPRANNGMQQPNGFQMQNMMAFNANDHRVQAGTPPINGMVSSPGQNQLGPTASPRMGQHPPGFNIDTSRIESRVKQQYPTATPDQVTTMVNQQLQAMQRQPNQANNKLAQSAMNAAAGASSAMNGQARGVPTGLNEKSPQLYAQMLRQQQENQQKAMAAAGLAAVQGQNVPPPNNGQQAQGHAHRNSAGSANSVK